MIVSALRPAIVLIAFFTVLTGLALPLGFNGLGATLLPYQAGGSLVMKGDTVIGSALIGQVFTGEKYFHGRPSATTDTDPADATKTVPAPYNASSSGASNMAPTSQALIDRVKGDIDAAGPTPVPADAVTTSASGLDPHISPANAARQVARVATARGLRESDVQAVLDRHTAGRLFGLIGEPRVNVLEVNLALDAEK